MASNPKSLPKLRFKSCAMYLLVVVTTEQSLPRHYIWKNRNIFTQHIVIGVGYPSGLIRFRPQAHPWAVARVPDEFYAGGL